MISYAAQCLVRQWIYALRQSRSLLKRFTHFLREGGLARPVRAWNVDIISRPLYLAVNCSVSLASEHRYADFWEMIPGMVSAFYAPCSAVGTCVASVYEALGRILHVKVTPQCSSLVGCCRARCCAQHVRDGPDNAELPGGAAGAVPARLWSSLCSCSDKFPAVPGRGSDPFIDKIETD